MASFNQVILMGNITRDPELKMTQGGAPYCNFGIAVNETWKDGQGNKQERVDFFNITAWSGLAETIANYKKKGDPIMVTGKLQFRQYEDKNTGEKRSAVDVKAISVQFLPRAGGTTDSEFEQANGYANQRHGRRQPQPQQRAQRPVQQQPDFDPNSEDYDDIPF